MTYPVDPFADMLEEFERLGLDYRDLPSLAIGSSEEEAVAFLAHVRGLEQGATWHDVYPQLPADWIPGQVAPWTYPFTPFGPYDYQALPVGAAVLVGWEPGTDPACLAEFVERSRAAGFAIYGAGFWGPVGTPDEVRDAMIIFDRAAGPDATARFWAWVDSQGDMAVHWLARTGREVYAPTP